MERARAATVAVLLVCLAATVLGQGRSGADMTGGSFACRGSAINLLGIEPVVANPSGGQCAPESHGAAPSQLLSAATKPLANGATSRAHLIALDLPAVVGLGASLINAEATVVCEGATPRLSGTSHVIGLKVNGVPTAASGPLDIPLGVGTLHLNRTIATANSITVRAVWLESRLGTVILGEARVGFTGTPCASPPPPVPAGTIIINENGGPPTFDFTGDLGPFSIQGRPASGVSTSQTFNVPSGRYRIVQKPTPGWFLATLDCSDPDGDSTAIVMSRSVSVDLEAGEIVVCTFGNRTGIVSSSGLANTGGFDNPNRGVEPIVFKNSGSEKLVVIPPTEDPTHTPIANSAPSFPVTVLAIIGALLLIVGALWFFLVGGRKRRTEDT